MDLPDNGISLLSDFGKIYQLEDTKNKEISRNLKNSFLLNSDILFNFNNKYYFKYTVDDFFLRGDRKKYPFFKFLQVQAILYDRNFFINYVIFRS